MFKKLNGLLIKLLFLIFLILSAIGILNADKLTESIGIEKGFIVSIIIFLEFFSIIIFLRIFYETPINNLIVGIKFFLLGDSENSEEYLQKTKNENINYVINFFKRVIFSLKGIKDEFLHGKEIKGEVSIAKEIQGKMLGKKLLEIPSLNIIMASKPAGEVGGDSYDILKNNETNDYYIYVGDATGHGVGAGFIMTMTNALIESFVKTGKGGAEILSGTNSVLKPRLKANLLMSLLLLRWNEDEKKLFMTGAGHEYLIIYKQNLKKTFKVKSGGVALGMVKDISKIVKEIEIKVDPGDIIVLYSDGITEAINKPKRDGTESLFGEDRLVEAIQKSPEIPGTEYKSSIAVYKSITIALSKFMGYKHTQLDDITLGVIQYKPKDYDYQKDFSTKIDEEFITEWNW